MKAIKVIIGGFLALLALGFLMNIGKLQSFFGASNWYQQLTTEVFAVQFVGLSVFFALSIWGSLALFRSADTFAAAKAVEFFYGSLLGLFGWFLGHLTAGGIRSTVPLLLGTAAALLEAAIMSLLSLVGVIEGMNRPGAVLPTVVFVVFLILEVAGCVVLFRSAFNRPGDAGLDLKSNNPLSITDV